MNLHLSELKSILDGTNAKKDARWETQKALKLANNELSEKHKVTLNELRANLIADCDVEDIKSGDYTTEQLVFIIKNWAQSEKINYIVK
jgi:hypothetical protein